MSEILITGGNGYIGSHIVDKFIQNHIKPVCLVRKGSDLGNLDVSKVEIRYGDIRDESSLGETFRDVDAVIHNAAYVRDWGPYKNFVEVNIVGTMNVLRACRKHGIDHIIMTGSISSYGEENCLDVKDERSGFNPHYPYFMHRIFPNANNYYRDTKAEGTRQALAFAETNAMNLTIVEPVWVYGEREYHTGFYEYIKAVKEGIPALPGSKKNKFHVVYVQDLARAYFLAYRKKLEGLHRIIIGNQTAPLMSDVFSLFCRKAGLKYPLLIPKWIVYPAGFILELLYTVFGSKNPPLMTRGRVNMFYDNLEYSTHKANELLGFSNEFSLDEGIERTVRWYKVKGLI